MRAWTKLRKFLRIAANICSFIMGMGAASAIILYDERTGTGGGELLIPVLGALLVFLGWQWRGLVDSVKK